MGVAGRENYAEALKQRQSEVRQLVMDGLETSERRKDKEFQCCLRQIGEKKYTNAKV